MSITAEIQSLSPSAIIELYELDMSYRGLPSRYFHSGASSLNGMVTWRGQGYSMLPVEAEGFEVSGTNKSSARPRFRVANIQGIFSSEVREYDDLVGAKLIRRRTFVKFLDPVNFPGGVNPSYDPNQGFPDDVWFVEQKVSENMHMIEWELASAFDLQGVMLPHRQIIQNGCPSGYRIWNETTGKFDYTNAGECGYARPIYFDKDDQPVSDPSKDRCGKRLSSCKLRFPTGALPFGGFPGAVRLQ